MATATQERKTELAIHQSPFSAPIKFEVSMEQIEELKREYMPLAILDVNDKAQVAKVHEARMDVVRLIRGIEKGGKEMRDDANKFAKNVIAAERTFTTPLIAIRDHLANEEGKVQREKDRIAKEAAEKKQAVTRERLAKLQACGKSYLEADIADLPDDEFESLHKSELASKQRRDDEAAAAKAEADRVAAEQKAEADRLAKVAADQERERKEAEHRYKRFQARAQGLAELGHVHAMTMDQLADMDADHWEDVLSSARLAKQQRDDAAKAEQAALDKQRADQAAAQAKIDAENKRIYERRLNELHSLEFPGQRYELAEDVTEYEYAELVSHARELRTNYEQKQAADLAKAKAEAAEQARIEANAEQDRIAEAEKAHAEAVEKERLRVEALRPDHEKLLAVADAIEAIQMPEVSDEATAIAKQIKDSLRYAANDVRGFCSDLIRDSAA